MTVLERRAPVVTAGNRPADAVQTVGDAVFQTAHAPQLRFEGIEGKTERQEHQAGTIPFDPRHRTAHHERFGGEAFLGGAFDVGGDRRVIDFFVVAQATAHDVVLLIGRHGVEAFEVMLPLLDRGEAATDQTVSAFTDQRSSHGGFIVRVFGAVFVTGQVVAGHVAEGFVHLHQTQGRRQRGFDGIAAIEQFATVDAMQPAPQRVLGRRIVDADAGQRRKRPQPSDLPVQRLDQGFTETDHCRFPVHQLCQLVERGRQCIDGFQREEHMTGLRRYWGGENARLVVTHMNSLRKSAKFTRSVRRCVFSGQKIAGS